MPDEWMMRLEGHEYGPVDLELYYTYVNGRAVGRAREAWGRDASAEELLGKNCWELFPEHLGTTFDRELHRAVREQRVVEFETYSAQAKELAEIAQRVATATVEPIKANASKYYHPAA